MRPLVSKLCLVAVAVWLAALTLPSVAVSATAPSRQGLGAGAGHAAAPSRELALRQTMRKLWEDHVTWTRLVIVSAAANLPDLDATTGRLLKNQVDIGDAIKPFYGEAAGNSLAALLRVHILGAAEILAAAKANDPARLEAAKRAWYANGDEIAGFLSAANPKHWPLAGMQSMMREHLDLTLTEAVDQLHGRYAQSVAGYDRVHDAILGMADMLSDGILAQFPGRP